LADPGEILSLRLVSSSEGKLNDALVRLWSLVVYRCDNTPEHVTCFDGRSHEPQHAAWELLHAPSVLD
jgi:hypothetical protein